VGVHVVGEKGRVPDGHTRKERYATPGGRGARLLKIPKTREKSARRRKEMRQKHRLRRYAK